MLSTQVKEAIRRALTEDKAAEALIAAIEALQAQAADHEERIADLE